jgi:hypothetical protein
MDSDDLEGVAVSLGRFVGDRPSETRGGKDRDGAGDAEGVISGPLADNVDFFCFSISV